MLRSGYRLPFTIAGIPIRLDATFALLVVLLTWLIGTRVGTYADLLSLDVDPARLEAGATPWLLGLAGALGLVLSVLLHELAHALVARRFGVTIREIRLWILGGIAQFDEMPERPRDEAIVAIAGPVASLLLGVGLGGVVAVVGASAGVALVVLAYLATVNVVLAVFNLLPALPMDGGRVLRALLAMALGPLRATRIAATVSQVVAVGMGLFGLVTFNLFLVAIAVFVYAAVQAETRHAIVRDVLDDVPVREIMTREVETVGASMSVADFVDTVIARRHVFFPVVGPGGDLLGTLRLQDLEAAPRDASVGDVMRREVATIAPTASAADAFAKIAEVDGQRLIVQDAAGSLAGIVSSTDLLRSLQVRLTRRRLDDADA
ncbi:MAG: site-2 protease family protein [Trueperaceae bacterium]|nr:site-2 protease family protein [Trueperaceae bacterium]